MEFFYSQQLRQYRLQVMRAFSNFSVSFGKNADGTDNLHRVPCRYGDSSRIAETIIAGNSENKMPSAPFISVYVTGLALAPERRQAPSLVSTVNVNEREYDGENQKYLETPGNRYTVQRYMPVPFNLTFNVDIWTSNLDQKEQLIEQTQVLYNGMIDIQTSNNPLDWSAMTTMEPTNITWSSRSIPIGTDNPIDVFSVEYKVPILINPPAKVQYQRIIQEIVTNINTGIYDPVNMEWTETEFLSREITTPDNARIALTIAGENVYEIELQNSGGLKNDPNMFPTKITGVKNPTLTPSAVFKFNGYSITVPNTSVDDLISVIRQQTQNTSLNAAFNLHNQIELSDNSGGDITLENIVGNQIEQMGFVATVYKGGTMAWWRLFEKYGTLKSYDEYGTSGSQLRLLTNTNLDDRTNDLIGYIQLHPTNQNIIKWFPDQTVWPTATILPLTAIIDPQITFPNQNLTEPRVGQRYLLLNQIAETSAAWGQILPNFVATGKYVATIGSNTIVVNTLIEAEEVGDSEVNEDYNEYYLSKVFAIGISPGTYVTNVTPVPNSPGNYVITLSEPLIGDVSGKITFSSYVGTNDIIEWNGSTWVQIFDSIRSTGVQYVMNSFSQKWFKWINGEWIAFPDSEYNRGYWRLAL